MIEEEIINLFKKVKKEFYVYSILRKDRSPFYVGKGKIRKNYYNENFERIFDHKRDSLNKKDKNKRKMYTILKILNSGKELEYKIYKFFNNDKDACKLEMGLIKKYGRLDLGNGILTNMTWGGDTMIGFTRSEELREKDRKTSLEYNKKHPEKGIVHSKFMKEYYNIGDNRKKKSETTKNSYIKDPTLTERRLYTLNKNREKNPEKYKDIWKNAANKMYEENPESKIKIGISVKKLWEDPDYRERQTKKRKEVCNKPEVKLKNSNAQKKVHQERKYLINECLTLIKTHQIPIKTFPSKKSSIKTFQKVKNILLNYIKENGLIN